MMVLARVLQVLIALLLLTSAVGKLLDNQGFADVLVTYQLFPASMTLVLGLCMSLCELLLGVWLLSGIKLAWSAGLAVLLHLQFAAIAVVSNARGLTIPNCGCFGVFWARPMTWVKVAEDAFLSGLCLCLFLLARKIPDRVELTVARRTDHSLVQPRQ